MYEHDEGLSAAIGRRRAAEAGVWPFPGRHESHEELEEETPIFHALTVGGWRSRQRGSGRAVRSVHRPTVRQPRSSAGGTGSAAVPARRGSGTGPGGVGDALAAFHAATSVPEQYRARRDAERAADRVAIAHLLGGAGRHRLGTPA